MAEEWASAARHMRAVTKHGTNVRLIAPAVGFNAVTSPAAVECLRGAVLRGQTQGGVHPG